MLKEYLVQLAREMKLDEGRIRTKEAGLYQLMVDEETTLEMSEVEDGVYIYTELSSSPSRNALELYTELMNANTYNKGTLGAILGLTDDARYLTLSRYIDYQPIYQEWRDLVEDFVNTAKYWQEKTKEHI